MEPDRPSHAGRVSAASPIREAMSIEVMITSSRYNNQLNTLMAKDTWTEQEEQDLLRLHD